MKPYDLLLFSEKLLILHVNLNATSHPIIVGKSTAASSMEITTSMPVLKILQNKEIFSEI